MEHNYIKLSNRSVQIDDIIFISEIKYDDDIDIYYFNIIYADKNHIRLEKINSRIFESGCPQRPSGSTVYEGL